jgi:hypothetical protein
MARTSKADKERTIKIEKAIRLVWGSLESHLYYTHDGELARSENHQFHKDCVKEYSEVIQILADLL